MILLTIFSILDTEVEFGEVCNAAQFDCRWAGCENKYSKICKGSCIPKANVNDTYRMKSSVAKKKKRNRISNHKHVIFHKRWRAKFS